MDQEKPVFRVCSEVSELNVNTKKAVSIFFICTKGLDVEMFAILQTLGLLTGLRYGSFQLATASSVLFVEGHKTVNEIASDFATCAYAQDLSRIKILSMPTYNTEKKANILDQDITVVNPTVIEEIEDYAGGEEQPSVVFHDFHSLSAGGVLCKGYDLRDLHNRLKTKGVFQLYFVNSEAEAMQIAVKPDLVFIITKNSDAELHPTIKVSLHSAPARLQDTFLPLELELIFGELGTWRVETSLKEADQDAAIKSLAKLRYNHKRIASVLGNISPSTVGRRLHAMQERGEIIIKGHRVFDA